MNKNNNNQLLFWNNTNNTAKMENKIIIKIFNKRYYVEDFIAATDLKAFCHPQTDPPHFQLLLFHCKIHFMI